MEAKSCQLVMNKIETAILTPRGDVLVCRCRHSSSNFLRNSSSHRDIMDTDGLEPGYLCDAIHDTSLCYPCNATTISREEAYAYYKNGAGVLGGQLENQPLTAEDGSSKEDVNDHAKSVSSTTNGSLIMEVPSFDYSYFSTSSNLNSPTKPKFDRQQQRIPLEVVSENAAPPKQISTLTGINKLFNPFYESPTKSNQTIVVLTPPTRPKLKPSELTIPNVLHGVPTSIQALNQIRITTISAHPLGEHVLMISSEALLFSYGSNKHGQLGLGVKSTFIRSPTIVTPLLESGGKAISCAAGMDHSLVVVKTEGQRVGRLRTKQHLKSPRFRGQHMPSHAPVNLSRATSTPVRLTAANDGDIDDNDGLLYHHQLYGFGRNDSMKLGLINPPIDERVSVPRRVALHTKVWPVGNNDSPFPPAGIFQVAASAHHSAALVKRATGDIEVYTWGEASGGALGVPLIDTCKGNGISPMMVGSPSLIQALSFSSSGSFQSILQPNEFTKQVSLGPQSTFITTSHGRCFSFGTSEDGLLGIGKSRSLNPTIIEFPQNESIESLSIGAKHALAKSTTGAVHAWGRLPLAQSVASKPRTFSSISSVSTLCAGYDSSAFVTVTGTVLTCGERSGRLGQGEQIPDSKMPGQLLGGLRLWRNRTADF